MIVSQYFWPEGFRINEIARSLVSKGNSVDVLTGKPNYPEGRVKTGYKIWDFKKEDYHGVFVHRVPLIPRGRNNYIRLAINYLSYIIFATLFGPWILRGRKYDIIFIYGLSPLMLALPGIFLSWINKIPVVLWVQDLWPQSVTATGYVNNKYIIGVIERVVRFIYRKSDLILVQSQGFIKPVSEMSSGAPIKYYPNSVDESFVNPVNHQLEKLPGLESSFSVMFAGNIGAAQAVEVIIEAANILKRYKEIQFVIVGDGSRREWMLQQVKTLGLDNLHLPGRYPIEMMPPLMQKASVLLVTLADQEIFSATIPNKVQAYLAAGRPIIACLNGEGARIIKEADAGFAVQAEDATGLAESILKMYKMSVFDREKMGINARNYFMQHFENEKLILKLMGYFEEIRGLK